jgi:hypothetical protein
MQAKIAAIKVIIKLNCFDTKPLDVVVFCVEVDVVNVVDVVDS